MRRCQHQPGSQPGAGQALGFIWRGWRACCRTRPAGCSPSGTCSRPPLQPGWEAAILGAKVWKLFLPGSVTPVGAGPGCSAACWAGSSSALRPRGVCGAGCHGDQRKQPDSHSCDLTLFPHASIRKMSVLIMSLNLPLHILTRNLLSFPQAGSTVVTRDERPETAWGGPGQPD